MVPSESPPIKIGPLGFPSPDSIGCKRQRDPGLFGVNQLLKRKLVVRRLLRHDDWSPRGARAWMKLVKKALTGHRGFWYSDLSPVPLEND